MLPLIEEFKQKLLQEYKCPANMTNIISICFKLEDWYGSDCMEKITSEDLNKFKTYLMTEYITREGTHFRKSTAIAKLVGIKRYFAFLVENKVISRDPTRGFEIPKKRQELPPYLPTEDEIWELINKVDTSTPEGVRDKAVIALMSIMPLKNKDVMVLTIDQVDLANRCVYPRKGSKELKIAISDPVFEILDKYLAKDRYHFVRWLKAPTDLLFVSRWGKPFTDTTLNIIFKKYNRYAKDKRIYPFLMRQATANHMRKNGTGVHEINKILGVKINTAITYTTLARNEIRAEQERYVAKIPLFTEFKEKLIKDELLPTIIHKILKRVVFFAKFLKSEDMKDLTPSDIERCKNYIFKEHRNHEGRKVREEDAVARLNSLKTYFHFLHEQGYLKVDPAASVETPSAHPRVRWYLPTEEDAEEFASRPDSYSYVGIRDAAMIRLWHLAPLKSHEQKDLKVQDIDLMKRIVYWREARRYGLKLDEKTYKAIERYLKVSRPVFAKKSKVPTDTLFLNEWGDPLVECSIFEIFWKYRGDKKIKPYATRHMTAIDMLRDGASLEKIKKALGIKSIKMCEAYKAVIADDVSGFYKRDRFEEKVKLLKRQKSIV